MFIPQPCSDFQKKKLTRVSTYRMMELSHQRFPWLGFTYTSMLLSNYEKFLCSKLSILPQLTAFFLKLVICYDYLPWNWKLDGVPEMRTTSVSSAIFFFQIYYWLATKRLFCLPLVRFCTDSIYLLPCSVSFVSNISLSHFLTVLFERKNRSWIGAIKCFFHWR